jgi:OPA family glycerol-3-phosphate transporter-like MFS transporter
MLPNPPAWATELAPILGLLLAILVVVRRLPKVDLGHSAAFVRRRAANWLPLGLTYGFLYMGRYNLSVYQKVAGALLTKQQFGTIFAVGTVTYGLSFLLNGPLTDRWGGRATILLSAVGAAAANVAIGLVLYTGWTDHLVAKLAVLYAINMYFQSFGAVSIVKVNAYWFHLRERGVIGGVFGILISLGLYFAYDWGGFIVKHYPHYMVFFVPAAILLAFAGIDWYLVQNAPSVAGFDDFDVGDASHGRDEGRRLGVVEIAAGMLRNRAIVIIALVEFMSGYLRNAILVWYPRFANEVGQGDGFVAKHWGMMSCIAGILGGMFAGVISDRVFDSRRGPVSAVLYGGMLGGALMLLLLLGSPLFGWVMVFMSLCIIGVHGMLSGTASMDFGGKRNAGIAVGIIDGFVYLGVAAEALVLGKVLPEGPLKADVHNWWTWPVAMLPAALVGLVLAAQLWNARPTRAGGGH